MDSISQGLLGAAIGEVVLGKRIGNKGALIGAMVATIPDLDVVFHLFYSKLDMLSIHRGFSHSILFSIIGAFAVAFLLSKLKWFVDIKFKLLLIFTWLCLFTHILLDTFTAYGTQLLFPFSNARIGFDSINVVDPFYTVPLLLGLILSLWIFRSRPNRSSFNKYGLIISSLYLVFTLLNKEVVKLNVSERLSEEGVQYESLMTMPVGIGNVNWYGVAKRRDSIFMVKHSILSKSTDAILSFPINEKFLDEVDEDLAEEMRWFAKGFYTVEKVDKKIRIFNLQVDMRGVVDLGGNRSPTAGYFEISTIDGKSELSSGSLK